MTDRFQSPRIQLPNIHLVYGTPSFPQPDSDSVRETILGMNTISENDNIDVYWEYQEAQKCLGQVKIGPHIIRIAGLSTPMPQEVVDCTIHPSPWGAQIKAAMRQHQSHLSLVYIGNHHDPVEKMIALYTIAHAFINEDLLGLLNENAWTAHPPGEFLTPERIQGYRGEIPFQLWFGTVKFYVNDENYWLVSKGHHIFDVPDLAYYVTPGDNVDEILDHFVNIFYYIFEKDVFVTAGDTLEISDSDNFLKFSEVPEGADFLMGPSGTLVIEKINPEDAARTN